MPGQTLNIFFGLNDEASLGRRTHSFWSDDNVDQLVVGTFFDGPGA
jgi:hypothetical protein